jgi:hypothetical protein
MKPLTSVFFWISSIYGSILSGYQIAGLVLALDLGVIPGKIGFSLAPRAPHLFLLGLIVLNLLMLAASIYFGIVGRRLFHGDLRGLVAASVLAFLFLPIGPVAGILGLVYACQMRGKNPSQPEGAA